MIADSDRTNDGIDIDSDLKADEAIQAIQSAGVEVCPVVLHQRKPFASRIHEGRTATEIDPKGKAANETHTLLLWICEKVFLLPK